MHQAIRNSRSRRHLRSITRTPRAATNVAPEVKITFVIDVLEATIPLVQDKNPQNPLPPGS